MRDVNRRTFLSAAATATALGGSGLAAGTAADGNESSTTAQFQFDTANSGYALDRVGAKQFLADSWSFEDTNLGVVGAPAVADGVVYAVTVEETIEWGKASLRAFDAETGTQRWRTKLDGSTESPPLVADGTVYLGNTQRFYAIDAETGDIEWTADYPSSTSPKVVGDTVYAATAKGLVALDKGDGSEQWQFENDPSDPRTERSVGATPAVVDGTVYYAAERHGVFALDATTGEKKWEVLWDDDGFYLNSDAFSVPTVADGTVYVGQKDLLALDAATGDIEWLLDINPDPRTVGYNESVAVVDGTVYHTGSGDIIAFDTETAEKQWQRAYESVTFESSPTVADGVVYASSTNGELYAFDAEDGTIRGQFRNDDRSSDAETTAAVPADGTVYFGVYSSNGGLYAVTEAQSAWSRAPELAPDASPNPASEGELVTIDAKADGDDDAQDDSIVELRWDFGADGSIDRTTVSSAIEHEFEAAGTHDVRVTAVDAYGSTTTETVSVEVTGGDHGGNDGGHGDNDDC